MSDEIERAKREGYEEGFKAGYQQALNDSKAIFRTPIPEQTPQQIASAQALVQEALDHGYYPGSRRRF
jgi:flagellar biosynthesis/type III secretory pathway protein FliH